MSFSFCFLPVNIQFHLDEESLRETIDEIEEKQYVHHNSFHRIRLIERDWWMFDSFDLEMIVHEKTNVQLNDGYSIERLSHLPK